MDHITDSESCTACSHDHYPYMGYVAFYTERRDDCGEPGCDCEKYARPDSVVPRVYKCSSCGRMVTRVWSSFCRSGYECDDCHSDD